MFNWFLVFQSSVLALDESALDVDQVENLIKFCPTKEEMELLKVTSIINPSLYLKFCIFELIILILWNCIQDVHTPSLFWNNIFCFGAQAYNGDKENLGKCEQVSVDYNFPCLSLKS